MALLGHARVSSAQGGWTRCALLHTLLASGSTMRTGNVLCRSSGLVARLRPSLMSPPP